MFSDWITTTSLTHSPTTIEINHSQQQRTQSRTNPTKTKQFRIDHLPNSSTFSSKWTFFNDAAHTLRIFSEFINIVYHRYIQNSLLDLNYSDLERKQLLLEKNNGYAQQGCLLARNTFSRFYVSTVVADWIFLYRGHWLRQNTTLSIRFI